MTEPTATYIAGVLNPAGESPLPSVLKWQIGKPSPRLLAIRQRDARSRYEGAFGHPPPEEILNALDGWSQVAWMERAFAETHIPKWLGTFTPPSPYRVFRLITTRGVLA